MAQEMNRLSKVVFAAKGLGPSPDLWRAKPLPFHVGEQYRPFFIVGPGRCGSTLLRRILQAHPQLHIPPENHGLARALQSFHWARFTDWSSAVAIALAHCEYSPGFVHYGIGLRDTAAALKDIPDEERSLARIIDAIYRAHAAHVERSPTYWGDKTPMNIWYLDQIRLAFPDCRLIHMCRDGVDVVHSMCAYKLAKSPTKAAERWVGALASIDAARKKWPDDILDVRYENLVADPAQTTERVCQFVGVSFRPDMIVETKHVPEMGDAAALGHHRNVFEPISDEFLGRGRQNLTSQHLSEIKSLLDPHLERYGYARVPVGKAG